MVVNAKVNKLRSTNIELLRILTMIGIIILHYNNPAIGGGLTYVNPGSVNFYLLYTLESLFICAVNLFILISGYFMYRTNRRTIIKPIQLLVQVILFSIVLYSLKVSVGQIELTAGGVIRNFIPSNWFVILYSTLYFISPYFNLILSKMNGKQIKQMLVIIILLFSVWPTIVDVLGEIRGENFIGLSSIGMYGSQWGYSIVNFSMLYIIGAYIRKNEEHISKYYNSKKYLMYLFINMGILVIWAMLNDKIGFLGERSAWEYCNPFVISEATIIFIIFSNIKIKNNKYINNIAKSCFTIFLLQNTFIGQLNIEKYVLSNSMLMLGHLLISSISICLACWFIWWVYDKLSHPIYELLQSKIKFLRYYYNG